MRLGTLGWSWAVYCERRLLSGKVGPPKRVRVVEVGPRDGLQNEKLVVPTNRKISMVEDLVTAGIRDIEVTAFVSPKWVPQLADAKEVFAGVAKDKSTTYSVLVPNVKGLQAAADAGVMHIAVFAAASQAFSMKNLNCSVEESLKKYEEVCARALDMGMQVRGYVSTVVACPYEGRVDPTRVVQLAENLLAMGCYEVSLGDTIGVATPNDVENLLDTVAKHVPLSKIAVHFHDTRGTALANVLVALEKGVHVIDSSVGGLGGCPFAPGASGNLATEDLLYMLHGMGIDVGDVDLKKVAEVGNEMCKFLGRPSGSKCGLALLSQRADAHP